MLENRDGNSNKYREVLSILERVNRMSRPRVGGQRFLRGLDRERKKAPSWGRGCQQSAIQSMREAGTEGDKMSIAREIADRL